MHTYVAQRPAAYFDWQVEQGEENGIYFKYVVMDKRDWVSNHLLDVGIFHPTGHGYYQPEGTKERWLLQQWWRYLIARWGYSTAVQSWELNNEGPPDSSDHWQTAQDFAKFMHENDSHPHLATTSFWCCWRPEVWGDNEGYPDIDYADIHKYTGEDTLEDGSLAAYDVAAFQSEDSLSYYSDQVGKPVLRGETGLSSPGDPIFEHLTQPNPGIWYHNLLWAQLGPGGLSDPNYWWSEHVRQIDSSSISKPFYLFMRELDINKGGYDDLEVEVTNAGLRVLGQKNLSTGKAQLWIQNIDHTWRNVMGVENPVPISPQSGTIRFTMIADKEYLIEWWDTYRGSVTRTETVKSDAQGVLSLTISALEDDVAVRISGSESPQPTFVDVPFDHWAHDEIDMLYQEGYVAGCSTDPLMYCPEQIMTRAESAVFVDRGNHGAEFNPPDPTEVIFADVTLDAWYADWIHQLWDDGYTSGCGTEPLIYCPEQGHTRTEGCVFFLRMMHGVDYVPPDPQGIFVDVPLDWWGAKWIEAAYSAGLIPACETDPEPKFCPDDPLDRAMGATMMVQAKGLE